MNRTEVLVALLACRAGTVAVADCNKVLAHVEKTDIIIREARAEELDAILKLEENFKLEDRYSRYHYLMFMGNRLHNLYVAVKENQIIGNGLVTYNPQKHLGHVVTMAVNPGVRRLGVGKALLDLMIASVREKKGTKALLEVETTNTDAIKFYTSFHFEISKVLENYYAKNRHGYLMTLIL